MDFRFEVGKVYVGTDGISYKVIKRTPKMIVTNAHGFIDKRKISTITICNSSIECVSPDKYHTLLAK